MQALTADDEEDNAGEVGRGGGEGAEDEDEDLLDEGAARLAERVPDHVDGRLALGLLLRVEGDVGHLLAGVEERVLGRLAQHVLRRADDHRQHQRGHAQRRRQRREEACGGLVGLSRDRQSNGIWQESWWARGFK